MKGSTGLPKTYSGTDIIIVNLRRAKNSDKNGFLSRDKIIDDLAQFFFR